MAQVFPNRKIFAREPRIDGDIDAGLGGYALPEYLKTYHPPEGGTYSVYVDHPYPLKGHPFVEAITANNQVKRIGLILLTIIKPRRHWLNNALRAFARLGESIYDSGQYNPILKEEFYNNLPKGLWRLWYYFWLTWGIDEDVAYRSGRIIATMLQYDDAYYVRVADFFTEMDYQRLYNNPRKELAKGYAIYSSREKLPSISKEFRAVIGLTRFVLLRPKATKCLRQALQQVDFSQLQLDDADRYYGFNRPDYDVCGNTWEERKGEFERVRKLHIDKNFKTITINGKDNVMTTDAQNTKIIAAVQPLYADPDFATVSDLNVAVTQTPAAPQPVTDQVDVPKPTA